MSAEELIKQINQWTADFLGITTEDLKKLQENKGE